MSKPRRRRSPPRPAKPTPGHFVGEPLLPEPPAYVVRWHRVDEWARDNVLGDVATFESDNARVAGYRGTWVWDVNDDEEAYDRGIPVERFDDVPDGPGRERGGTRRVSIRLYTWVVDTKRHSCHEPQWITTGWGMTARTAAHAHGRWIDAYASAVAAGLESRRLVAVAMEIVFWTAAEGTDYV